jgi:hypothetical protein
VAPTGKLLFFISHPFEARSPTLSKDSEMDKEGVGITASGASGATSFLQATMITETITRKPTDARKEFIFFILF